VTDGTASVAASAKLDITPVDEAPPIDPVTPGTAGSDNFVAPAGNSAFDAGLGTDTITFDFRLVDATITWLGDTVTIVHGSTSKTVLAGFERFVFTDGTVENNDGSWLVDDLFYYSHNHDVWNARDRADAEAHFEQYGWHEGRDPNAWFDTSGYLDANPDVKAAGINPLTHFDQYGWWEGRLPSAAFDPAAYLAANPDVKAAGINPLLHFLQYGYDEDRQPVPVPAGMNGYDLV
jgi:serralysin